MSFSIEFLYFYRRVKIIFQYFQQLEFLVELWRLGQKIRWLAVAALIAAPMLLAFALWAAPQRHQALVHCSIGVGIAGLAILLVLPVSRRSAAGWIENPQLQGAVDGALRGYLGGLRIWGSFFIGLGVVFAAASSALIQSLDVVEIGRRVAVEPHPRRILSLAPSVTEVLFLLGAGDRVAGVTTHCDWPAAAASSSSQAS